MAEMDPKDALIAAGKAGRADDIQELFKHKNKPPPDVKDGLGNTALHYAAGAGHIQCIVELVKNRATVNAKNNIGDTPLHKAAAKAQVAAIKALVAAGADPSARNQDGQRPKDLTKNGDAIDALTPPQPDEPEEDEDDKKKKKKKDDDDDE